MEFLQTGAGYLNHQPYHLHHEVGRFGLWCILCLETVLHGVWSWKAGKSVLSTTKLLQGWQCLFPEGKVSIFVSRKMAHRFWNVWLYWTKIAKWKPNTQPQVEDLINHATISYHLLTYLLLSTCINQTVGQTSRRPGLLAHTNRHRQYDLMAGLVYNEQSIICTTSKQSKKNISPSQVQKRRSISWFNKHCEQ